MALAGKTIIITGTSSGIGAAAVKLFATKGTNLVLAERRQDELGDITASIRQGGDRAIVLASDIRDRGYAAALVDLALKGFGAMDGLQ